MEVFIFFTDKQAAEIIVVHWIVQHSLGKFLSPKLAKICNFIGKRQQINIVLPNMEL